MQRQTQKLYTIFILFVFLILVTPANSGIYNANTEFLTIKSEHFQIHFAKDLALVAKDVDAIAEKSYVRLQNRMNWKIKSKIHLVLTDNTDISNAIASVVPDNYITLIVRPPESDSSLEHYKNYLEYLLTHELTHIFHLDMYGRFTTPLRLLFGKFMVPNAATPRWMREGIAVYEESLLEDGFGRNNHPYTDMVLRSAYYEGFFPKIDQITGVSASFPAGAGPYLFGGKFFEFLADKYGEDRMYQYEKEYASSLIPFAVNNKARRVYGKKFKKLWEEFTKEKAAEYETIKSNVYAKGLSPKRSFLASEEQGYSHFVKAQNGSYAYFEVSHDKPSQIVLHLAGQKEPLTLKYKPFGQMSFSKDGRYLTFATLSSVEIRRLKTEVFRYDTKKKKLGRVSFYDEDKQKFIKKMTKLSDPDFSPADGGKRWLVAVRSHLNTDQLVIYDNLEKKFYRITNEPKNTQFSNPRFSPNGKYIVVSQKDAKTGFRDVVLYSNIGHKIRKITNDAAIDMHPVFSTDGNTVFFSSYKTGISNIFSYGLNTHKTSQVTNVLNGVFEPFPFNERELLVKTHHSHFTSLDIVPIKPSLYEFRQASQGSSAKSFYKENYKKVLQQVAFDSDVKKQNLDFFVHAKTHSKSNVKHMMTNGHSHDHSQNQSVAYLKAISQYGYSDQHYDDTTTTLPDIITQVPEELEEAKVTDSKEEKVLTKKIKKHPSVYKDKIKNLPYSEEIDPNYSDDELAKFLDKTEKYSPFPELFVPKLLIPTVTYFESAIITSLLTGKVDPLLRHSWTASANYRSDAGFVGGGATYVYSRYTPSFFAGALRYSVNWGTVNGSVFFEERYRAYGGVSFPFLLFKQRFTASASYFYEHRSAFTTLTGFTFLNMKPYAGVSFRVKGRKGKKYANSISQETGYKLELTTDVTHKVLGADGVNEQMVSTGDLRFFVPSPIGDHHVFAFRVGGGYAWGDSQQFNTFRLGGPFGDIGGVKSYSSRVFPLRGLSGITFAGDRAILFATEYRFPLLVKIDRGISTWPIFLKKLHMNLFMDGGSIVDDRPASQKVTANGSGSSDKLFKNILISTGAEIKGDFVIAYELPLTLRMGYGIIVTNRGRIANLSDALTGMSLTNGSAYIQFGTAF